MTSSPRRITLWLATPVLVFNLSATELLIAQAYLGE